MASKHRFTIEDFRAAVAQQSELPECCAKVIAQIDDYLTARGEATELLFISVFFDVLTVVFAGDPSPKLEKALAGMGKRAVEAGTLTLKDRILANAPDIPEFVSGLTSLAQGRIMEVITAHVAGSPSIACKNLHATKKFWLTMAEAFS